MMMAMALKEDRFRTRSRSTKFSMIKATSYNRKIIRTR